MERNENPAGLSRRSFVGSGVAATVGAAAGAALASGADGAGALGTGAEEAVSYLSVSGLK